MQLQRTTEEQPVLHSYTLLLLSYLHTHTLACCDPQELCLLVEWLPSCLCHMRFAFCLMFYCRYSEASLALRYYYCFYCCCFCCFVLLFMLLFALGKQQSSSGFALWGKYVQNVEYKTKLKLRMCDLYSVNKHIQQIIYFV